MSHDADSIAPREKAAGLARLPRLLVNAHGAAAMLGISPRHLETLVAQGLAPAPIRLGRAARWSVGGLAAWADAGCQTTSDADKK